MSGSKAVYVGFVTDIVTLRYVFLRLFQSQPTDGQFQHCTHTQIRSSTVVYRHYMKYRRISASIKGKLQFISSAAIQAIDTYQFHHVSSCLCVLLLGQRATDIFLYFIAHFYTGKVGSSQSMSRVLTEFPTTPAPPPSRRDVLALRKLLQ